MISWATAYLIKSISNSNKLDIEFMMIIAAIADVTMVIFVGLIIARLTGVE